MSSGFGAQEYESLIAYIMDSKSDVLVEYATHRINELHTAMEENIDPAKHLSLRGQILVYREILDLRDTGFARKRSR